MSDQTETGDALKLGDEFGIADIVDEARIERGRVLFRTMAELAFGRACEKHRVKFGAIKITEEPISPTQIRLDAVAQVIELVA